MSTNAADPILLSPGNILYIWVEDSMSSNKTAPYITDMLYSRGIYPNFTVVDRMDNNECTNYSTPVYNTLHHRWETDFGCSLWRTYDFRFHEIPNFSFDSLELPGWRATVNPARPPLFPANDTSRPTKFSTHVFQCNCRPSFIGMVSDGHFWVTNSDFDHFAQMSWDVGIVAAGFTDNSFMVVTDKDNINVTNFMVPQWADVHLENAHTLKGATLVSFCSLDLIRSEVGALASSYSLHYNVGDTTFYCDNLNDRGTIFTVEFAKSDATGKYHLLMAAGTTAGNQDFYVLGKGDGSKKGTFDLMRYHGNDFALGNRTEYTLTTADYGDLKGVWWSPFGYVFIFGTKVYVTPDTILSHFDEIQFVSPDAELPSSGPNAEYFVRCWENGIGQIIFLTSSGRLYYYSVDSPILTPLLTTINYNDQNDQNDQNEQDWILQRPDETFMVIHKESGNGVERLTNFTIPLESEIAAFAYRFPSSKWNFDLCPVSAVIDSDLPPEYDVLDKKDIQSFSGTITSKSGSNFVFLSTSNVIANISQEEEKNIRMTKPIPDYTLYSTKHTNFSISSLRAGLARVLITPGVSKEFCHVPSSVRNLVNGCPLKKEMRAISAENTTGIETASFEKEDGTITTVPKFILHYTMPYFKPKLQFFFEGKEREEYTGNFILIPVNSVEDYPINYKFHMKDAGCLQNFEPGEFNLSTKTWAKPMNNCYAKNESNPYRSDVKNEYSVLNASADNAVQIIEPNKDYWFDIVQIDEEWSYCTFVTRCAVRVIGQSTAYKASFLFGFLLFLALLGVLAGIHACVSRSMEISRRNLKKRYFPPGALDLSS